MIWDAVRAMEDVGVADTLTEIRTFQHDLRNWCDC